MQLGILTLQCCSPGVGGGEGEGQAGAGAGAGELRKRKAVCQARDIEAEGWQ